MGEQVQNLVVMYNNLVSVNEKAINGIDMANKMTDKYFKHLDHGVALPKNFGTVWALLQNEQMHETNGGLFYQPQPQKLDRAFCSTLFCDRAFT